MDSGFHQDAISSPVLYVSSAEMWRPIPMCLLLVCLLTMVKLMGVSPFSLTFLLPGCVVTVKKRQTMQMNWSLLESDGFLSAGDMDMLHFENVPPTA